MIPKIIHQIARSTDLTWEERMLVRRARRILPEWDYRLWTDVDPIKHMEVYFPQYATKFSAIASGVIRSDIGRYAFLHTFGGLYLDTDYKLLRNFDRFISADLLLPVEESTSSDTTFKLGNAILASRAGHDFWRRLIDDIFLTHYDDLEMGNPVLLTGPVSLTRTWEKSRHELGSVAMPGPTTFYPPLKSLNFSFHAREETHGVHLCWGSWRGKKGLTRWRNIIRRKVTAVITL